MNTKKRGLSHPFPGHQFPTSAVPTLASPCCQPVGCCSQLRGAREGVEIRGRWRWVGLCRESLVRVYLQLLFSTNVLEFRLIEIRGWEEGKMRAWWGNFSKYRRWRQIGGRGMRTSLIYSNIYIITLNLFSPTLFNYITQQSSLLSNGLIYVVLPFNIGSNCMHGL